MKGDNEKRKRGFGTRGKKLGTRDYAHPSFHIKHFKIVIFHYGEAPYLSFSNMK